MPSIIFNVSKGRTLSYLDRVIASDPVTSRLKLVYAKEIESDELLRTRTSYQDLFAEVANTECDFNNYTIQELSGISVGIDDPEVFGTASDVVIQSAGTSTAIGINNTIQKAILFYDENDINNAIPLFAYDFVISTNGNSLTFRIPIDGLCRLA